MWVNTVTFINARAYTWLLITVFWFVSFVSVLIPHSWAQSFEVNHSSTRLITELKYRSKDQKLHNWIMFSEPKPCWNVVGLFCSKSIPRHYIRCNSPSWFSNKILNSSFVPSHDIFEHSAHWKLMMTYWWWLLGIILVVMLKCKLIRIFFVFFVFPCQITFTQ